VGAQLTPGSFDQPGATFAPHWNVVVFADEKALERRVGGPVSRLKLPGGA
jgi:hypothetical protein